MAWDTTIPEDDDLINAGPSVIRTLKTDIAAALTTQGSFPGADAANPKYKWTPEYGNTDARPSTSLVTGQLYINTQTGTIQRYNGTTWDDILSAADGAITAEKLAAAVAGDGLAGGAGTALSVNVDGSTIEINSDTLRVKDAGVTAEKLASAVAGDGLTNNGTGLVVNVDGSTIEINSDALRVKDAGITEPKLSTALVNKLGQNIGLVSRVTYNETAGSWSDVLNYTGQGQLLGVSYFKDDGSSGFSEGSMRITIDGVSFIDFSVGSTGGPTPDIYGHIEHGPGSSTSMFTNIDADYGNLDELRVHFKTSVRVEVKIAGSGVGNGAGMRGTVSYERQA